MLKNYKKVLFFALFCFFVFLLASFATAPGLAHTSNTTGLNVTNNLASRMQESVGITKFNIYNSNFQSQDHLITGNSANVSPLLGQTLVQTGSKIDLSTVTPESDNVALGSTGVNLYDRPAYSTTFLNETYNAAVESNSTATTVTSMAISNHGTAGSFEVANDAVAASNYATQATVFAFDFTNNGVYTDAGDKAYLPIDPNLVQWLGVKSTFSASPNSADYGLLSIAYTRSTGVDYTVNVKMWATTGTNAWSGVGSTADNQATFNVYSSSGVFNALQYKISTLFQKDSSETGGIIGIHSITWKGLVAGASDSVTIGSTGIGLFNNYVAWSSNSDVQSTFNIDGASNLPIFDSADDLLSTSYTASTATSSLPLIHDFSGIVTIPQAIRYLSFTGVLSLQPTTDSYSSSQAVTSTNYFLTTENVYFDSRGISAIKTFANIFTISSVNINVTIDDSILEFTTHYQDNLYQSTAGDYANSFVVNGIAKGNTYEPNWALSTVSGSTSPKTQVQYAMSTFSATVFSLDHIVLMIYTKSNFNVQVSSSVANNNNVVAVSSNNNSGNSLMYIVLAVGGVVVIIILIARKEEKDGHKGNRNKKH